MLRVLYAAMLLLLFVFPAQAQDCPPALNENAFENGIALFECGSYAEAITEFQNALSSASEPTARADIQVYAGQAYLATGDLISAQTQFERAFLAYNEAGLAEQSGIAYYFAGQVKTARLLDDEALRYFYEGVRRSTQADDQANLGRLHDSIGAILSKRGEYEEAQREYQAALAAYESVQDVKGQVMTLRHLGDLAIDTGSMTDAEARFAQMLPVAEQLQDQEQIAYAQYRLSTFRRDRGSYTEAITLLESALLIYETLGDAAGIASVKNELGYIYADLGDYTASGNLLGEAREAALEAGDCVAANQSLLNNAYALILRGIYSQAITQASEVLSSDCITGNPRLRAQALLVRGEARIRAGIFIIGNDDLQFALNAYRELKDRAGERDTLLNLGRYHLEVREFNQSNDYLYTALRIAEETGSYTARIRTTLEIANVSLARRLYDEALSLMQTALNLAVDSGNTLAEARVLDSLANLYFTQSRYDEAINFYEQAAEQRGEDSTFGGQLLYIRGLIYEQGGDFELAERVYTRAGTRFEELGEQQNIMRVDLALAELYLRLNQYDQAQAKYDAVLERATTTNNNLYLAAALNGSSDLMLILWDVQSALSVDINETEENRVLDEAQGMVSQALNLYVEARNENGIAETLNRLGLIGMRRLIPSNAGTGGWFQEALGLSRALENVVLEAEILNNLGDYHAAIRDSNAALTYYNESLRLAEQFNPVLATQIKVKFGMVYERRSERDSAIRSYREAIDAIETIYASIDTTAEQLQFGSQSLYLHPYERLIRYYGINIIQDRLSDAATSLNYAERSRSRSFLFQLGGQDIAFGTGEDAELLQEWRAAREQIITLTDQLIDLRAQGGDTTDLAAQIDSIETRLQDIESSVEFSTQRQFIGVEVASIADIQSALDDDTVMVVYYLSRENDSESGRVFTWVIAKDKLELVPILFNSYETDIANRIDTFRQLPTSIQPLKPLYTLLIDPIKNSLAGYQQIVFVPHEILNYLPFEALPDAADMPLIANYDISYSPSATVYVLLRQQLAQTESTDQALIMNYDGNPADTDLPLLQFAQDEARTIGELVDTAPLIGDAATETALREQAANADVIHIAAHGKFDPQRPLSSFISLAADDTHDGRLQVQEIYSLSLRAHTPLIVLSACETAVSQINPGDEVQGMNRAFLLSGARGVVASLWSVDDFATAELMQAFYTNRTQGMSDIAALSAAKRAIWEQYGDPFLWAPFVFVGIGK